MSKEILNTDPRPKCRAHNEGQVSLAGRARLGIPKLDTPVEADVRAVRGMTPVQFDNVEMPQLCHRDKYAQCKLCRKPGDSTAQSLVGCRARCCERQVPGMVQTVQKWRFHRCSSWTWLSCPMCNDRDSCENCLEVQHAKSDAYASLMQVLIFWEPRRL